MTTKTRAELADQIARDRRALAEALAARRLGSFLDVELTLQQLKIVLLVATGTATTGRAIADHLHVTAPTVSASVDRLVELGYLRRDDSDADRRVKHLTPTEPAARLSEAIVGMRDESEQALVQLDRDDLEALARGTRAFRQALVGPVPEASP